MHSKLSDFNLPLHSVSYVHLATQHFGACCVPCTGDIKLNESRSYELPVLDEFPAQSETDKSIVRCIKPK